MSFTETINSIIDDSKSCDLTLSKINLFIEASQREFDIDCGEAELKVIQESGTQNDLDILCEAAQEGLVNRVINGIKTAIKALQEFIKSVVEKIKSAFSNKKTDEAIDKLEEACKTNPKLKNKKIEIYDIEGEQKCLQEGMDKLSAKSAKIQSGNSSGTDSKDIDDIVEQTSKKRAKIIAASTATVITVGAGIVLFKKLRKSVDGENASLIKNANDSAKKSADAAEKVLKGDFNNDEILAQSKATTSFIQLAKQKVSGAVSGINVLFKKLKGATVVDNPEVKKESVETDIDNSVTLYEEAVKNANYVSEGANIDYLKIYKQSKKDYKNYLKLAKTANKSGKYKEAISFFEKAKKEIEKAKNEIDKVEGKFTSSILSWCCSYAIDFIGIIFDTHAVITGGHLKYNLNKKILGSVLVTFGLTGAIFDGILTPLKRIYNMIQYAKSNDAAKTTNTIRVYILKQLDSISKAIDICIDNAKSNMKDKKLMKESVNDMTNSEIMEKVNGIFIEAAASDTMDVYEATELIDICTDLFTEAEGEAPEDSIVDDEEKAAKEKAKKTKKKLIIIISGCAAIVAGVTAAIAIYNKKTTTKEYKDKEGKKKAMTILADAKKIDKQAKSLLKKKSITDFEANEVDNLLSEYKEKMSEYNKFKFTEKRADKKNANISKALTKKNGEILSKMKYTTSDLADGFESANDDLDDDFDSLLESFDDSYDDLYDDGLDSLLESFDDSYDDFDIEDLLG